MPRAIDRLVDFATAELCVLMLTLDAVGILPAAPVVLVAGALAGVAVAIVCWLSDEAASSGRVLAGTGAAMFVVTAALWGYAATDTPANAGLMGLAVVLLATGGRRRRGRCPSAPSPR